MLKNDKRAVFQMAAHAERAVTFLNGLQPDVGASTVSEPARGAA